MTVASERYLSLDLLRGVAVMGILTMNIVGFALPEADYSAPAGPMSDGAGDRISWLIAYLFFDGKMMGLFTLLFGASAMLMLDRSDADRRDGGRLHFVRQFWLIAFGIAHFLFIWDGDILFYYGLCGLFLYAARHAPPFKLMTAALILLGMSWLFSLYLSGEVLAAGAQSPLTEGFGYSEDVYAAETARFRSDYGTILQWRLSELGLFLLNALELVPRLLGAMLLGAALYRSGFLTGAWQRRTYMKVAAIAIAVALPVQIALGYWAFASGFSADAMFCISYGLPAPFQLLMTVGYAALIVPVAAGAGRAIRAVAATGRMSLTNYIGTSVVMTAIFYGYGMGLFGRVERAELWWFVLGGWAAMLIGSNLWLARFGQGPFERLWRLLSRRPNKDFSGFSD